jgi:hypothetical protein
LTPLQRGIKKVIEENCKKGLYAETFSPEFQKEIKLKSEEVAILVTEDEEFVQSLDSSIEEAIRFMILR